VGTIFAIYKLADDAEGSEKDLLRPGTEMVASGFTMYGASAMLVITMKGGQVNGFTLDNALGEFILSHPNMRIPRKRAIYSVNEGNSLYWEEPVKEYIDSLKYPGEGGKPYSARYIGSMVADAYRTLLYGGIFAYPADKKSPKGKLRILYECAPMAMVFENGKLALLAQTLCWRSGTDVRLQLVAKRLTARWTACWRLFRRIFTIDQASLWAATTRCRKLSMCTPSIAAGTNKLQW
jgi:fructose-1,6-bisphosphatase